MWIQSLISDFNVKNFFRSFFHFFFFKLYKIIIFVVFLITIFRFNFAPFTEEQIDIFRQDLDFVFKVVHYVINEHEQSKTKIEIKPYMYEAFFGKNKSYLLTQHHFDVFYQVFYKKTNLDHFHDLVDSFIKKGTHVHHYFFDPNRQIIMNPECPEIPKISSRSIKVKNSVIAPVHQGRQIVYQLNQLANLLLSQLHPNPAVMFSKCKTFFQFEEVRLKETRDRYYIETIYLPKKEADELDAEILRAEHLVIEETRYETMKKIKHQSARAEYAKSLHFKGTPSDYRMWHTRFHFFRKLGYRSTDGGLSFFDPMDPEKKKIQIWHTRPLFVDQLPKKYIWSNMWRQLAILPGEKSRINENLRFAEGVYLFERGIDISEEFDFKNYMYKDLDMNTMHKSLTVRMRIE